MTAPLSAESIELARALLQEANRVVVLTGAGISAESGVPTFRGAAGLWKSYRPEDLATPEAFARDPRLVWEWYGWRRKKVGQCVANSAHHALAKASAQNSNLRIVTQNVDGLHDQARQQAEADGLGQGPPVICLHGDLFAERCTVCEAHWPSRDDVDASSLQSLPRCPSCGSLARPDIVWFGESLNADDLNLAFQLAELAAVCVVVGTAGVVHPAASIAAVCAQAGGLVIEVNPDETAISELCVISLRAPAAETLSQIFV